MGQTVYVVDDDTELRTAIAGLLGSLGFAVEVFASASEFFSRTNDTREGCLILDVRMPGASGLQIQQQLIDASAELPIIFITGHADIPIAVQAMKAGAIEFLQKPFREQHLIDAVNDALSRNDENRVRRSETIMAEAAYRTLTPAERRVMDGVVGGLMNKQIAATIERTEHTVKVHRSRVMQKMKVRTVAELVRLAGRIGISR